MTNISYYILNIHIIIYSLNDIFLSKQTCGLDDLREGFPQSVGPLKHMEQNLFKDRRKYWMELVFHSLYIYIYMFCNQTKALRPFFFITHYHVVGKLLSHYHYTVSLHTISQSVHTIVTTIHHYTLSG